MADQAQAAEVAKETVAETVPAVEESGTAETVAEETAAVGDLEDKPADPAAVSVAPARQHEGIVSQFEIRWHELKVFVGHLDGEIEGELGEVLALARKHL